MIHNYYYLFFKDLLHRASVWAFLLKPIQAQEIIVKYPQGKEIVNGYSTWTKLLADININKAI